MAQMLSGIQITKEKTCINPNNRKTIYIDILTKQQVPEPTVKTIDSKTELENAILKRNTPSGRDLGVHKALITTYLDPRGEFSKIKEKKQFTTKENSEMIL